MRPVLLIAFVILFIVPQPARAQAPGQSPPRTPPAGWENEDGGVQEAVARAERHFRLGEQHLRDRKREEARREFDEVVNVVIESGMRMREHPRLRTYFLSLLKRIDALEAGRTIPDGRAVPGSAPRPSYLRNTPGEVEREDPRVSKIVEDAEKHFRLGELNLANGKSQAAREEFDKAVDTVLESGMDVRSNPRLNRYYVGLVERIYGYEVPQAAPAARPARDGATFVNAAPGGAKPADAEVGFKEQKFEPSPLDELRRLGVGPSDVKEYAAKACDEEAFGRAELRGFRLGMSVTEVRARIPNLRPTPPDRFNRSKYFTLVRADRQLSRAPSLKDVRALSLEFVDDRVSNVFIVYDNTVRWESGLAFARQVSSALGLSERWVQFTGRESDALDDVKVMGCKGSVIFAGLRWIGGGRLPVAGLGDLTADAKVDRREKEAADRQREMEERRRKAFKP